MKPFALAAIPLAAAFAAAAGDSPIAGNWKIQTSIAGNDYQMACTITEKDGALNGKCTSDQGPVEFTGNLEGDKVSWKYKSEYNGTPLTVIYSGAFSKDAGIKGTVDVPEFGVSGDFTATLAK